RRLGHLRVHRDALQDLHGLDAELAVEKWLDPVLEYLSAGLPDQLLERTTDLVRAGPEEFEALLNQTPALALGQLLIKCGDVVPGLRGVLLRIEARLFEHPDV